MIVYEYAMRSLRGTRDEQQDRYCIADKNGMLFATVCDGMGGTEQGGDAAEMTIRLLQQRFQTSSITNVPHFFLQHIEYINAAVYDTYGRKGIHSGTTLVSCILQGENIFWCSVGDSRLYQVNRNGIRQLTVDHNYARVLEKKRRENAISEEELAREMKKGNALVSFIGMQRLKEVCINIRPLDWSDTDALVLMSDGLYNALSETEIASCNADTAKETVQNIEEHIMKKALTTLDNTTFIVMKRRKS